MRNLDSVSQPPLERNLFYIREGRFNHFLPYSICKTFYKSKGRYYNTTRKKILQSKRYNFRNT